ncbi:MAG TPA: RnfABCDGE type electron transport complex subunit G [Candidatus Scybalomonas excrementigallinarum]|nr:RnfABCDGE type electron transport complex subunit G [Candidatus Scybalomonas excrementigallinarum]
MNRILKEGLILFAITVIAGAALGGVYSITKNPIAAAQAKAEQQAYQNVMPDASEFVEDESVSVENANKVIADAGITGTEMKKVLVGKDASGAVVGYVMNVSNMEGYGGELNFTVGILADGTVTGYETLINNETAGLGQKAKEASFSDQFKNKKVEQFTVTKSGATSDDQIDAISGATITSNAMTKGMNACLAYFKTLGGAN